MIKLVLDTSAIRDYTTGSIHVGEPISEVNDEGGKVAVPIACLAEAARDADDHMLGLLAEHEATTLVPLLGEDWPFIVHNLRVLGRLDLASAMLTAADHGAHILTAEPDAYGEPGSSVVIPIY